MEGGEEEVGDGQFKSEEGQKLDGAIEQTAAISFS